MLKIRLKRVGRKNDPSFRVVVIERTNSPKSGKELEIVGNYDPKQKRKHFEAERIKYWLSKGAKTSATIHNMLVGEKIIDGKKINVLPRKSPIKKEEKKEDGKPVTAEAPAQAEAVVEEPKTEEMPVEEVKAEEPKEEPKIEEKPAEEVRTEKPKVEETKEEAPEETKVEKAPSA